MNTPTQIAELTDVNSIRAQFPILERQIYGQKLVYLDNAASSQKPLAVMNSIQEYYSKYHSNVHRGVHHLSQVATDLFEASRERMRVFVNAASSREIIFTKGTTDGINLVAYCLRNRLKAGDEILISEMEHHSNIVPWQMTASATGAKIVVVKISPDGSLDLNDFDQKLSKRTKIVSIVHISNALGTINPAASICEKARKFGALTLIDGAQAAPHGTIDVQAIGCDFYVLSGHKMYGPTGSGILYGREELLNEMPPYQGGGEMIAEVRFDGTTYNELPFKFEAGTPNIESAIGLKAAADYMESIGFENIAQQESALLQYATESLSEIDGLRLVGTANEKASVVSFLVDGTHPSDVGTILDQLGIAVRTGHHCTQPLMRVLGIPGTVRASFAVYNTFEEIDFLVAGIRRAQKMLN